VLTLLAALAVCPAPPEDYRKDLDFLLDSLRDYGAYVKVDKIDLRALRTAYEPKFASVKDKPELVHLLEEVVGELRDFHASLGTNNDASPRLVPSGTDIVGHWKGSAAVIDQVKENSLAAKAGVHPGDVVSQINGVSAREESKKWFGVRKPDARGWDWTLNSALAGRWDHSRNLTLLRQGQSISLPLPTAAKDQNKSPLTVEKRDHGILYLRVENSLGENELVTAFDKAVPGMRAAKGIVLDLRNTPSGGNSNVARGMMGLFIDHRLPFQRHRAEERDTNTVRDWVEYATPRLSKPIKAKLVVLVSRWTSSMGEGIAIGFDAMHRGTVVGTEMARLRGAVDGVNLPQSNIPVRFPTEQVFHINGTPRHEWLPPVKVVPSATEDAWWVAAKRILSPS